METIANELRAVFVAFFYPAVVVGVFLYLAVRVVVLVWRGRGNARARRAAAAVLPILLLVFALAPGDIGIADVQQLFADLSPTIRLLLGALVGVLILELGRLLARAEVEIGAAIYTLFLSGVAAFILHATIEGSLQNLHIFLLGVTVAGCLDMILRSSAAASRTRAKEEAQEESIAVDAADEQPAAAPVDDSPTSGD